MSARTPGKWYVDPPQDPEEDRVRTKWRWSVRYECTTGACISAEIAEITSMNTGHEEANARLMAASPDLLSALIDLRTRYETLFELYAKHAYSPETNPSSDLTLGLTTADLAITKATGGDE